MIPIVLIILIVILIIVIAKATKTPNRKKQVQQTGEEIYRISKMFLSKIKPGSFSDEQLQRIMTFIDGFSRYTEEEQECRAMFVKALGDEILLENPHIFVRIKDRELDCFIYSNYGYALVLNKETKDLELSKIK